MWCVREGGSWGRKGGFRRCGRRVGERERRKIAMGHRKEGDMDEGGGSERKGRW